MVYDRLLQPMGALTLIALAQAGGQAYSFAPLNTCLSDNLRLTAIDYPGHGRRIAEPLLSSIPELAQDILGVIGPCLEAPYAILGHSMGALVGYAMCLGLARDGRSLPRHLFVSGCCAPGYTDISPDLPESPGDRFWAELQALGGLPQEVLDEPAILELFEPILRADLKAVVDYRPPRLDALPLPVTVLGGDQDQLSREGLEAWRQCSSQAVSLHYFPGDHFFIFDNLPAVAELIHRQLGYE